MRAVRFVDGQVTLTDVPPPDLSWVQSDVNRFKLREPYVIFVPGSSPHRPDKRWPETCCDAVSSNANTRTNFS